jgi:alkylation response protein AidB-like acyl-CoA dehydrogenase
MRPAVRAGLIVVAVIAAAWFVIGIRQSTGLNRAQTILGSARTTLSAAQAGQARAAIDEASTLNPDRQVELDRSLLALDRGQSVTARHDAAAVTRAEPQNLDAWVALARTAGDDPALFSLALERVRQLEPRLP